MSDDAQLDGQISSLMARLPGIAAGAASIARMKANLSELAACHAHWEAENRAFEDGWNATHPEPPAEPEPVRRRQQRKLTPTGALKLAVKLGVELTVTADGSMKFTPKDEEFAPNNYWDRAIARMSKQ